MKNFIEDILLEWSLQTNSGAPNISNKEDLAILENVLSDYFAKEPNKNQIIKEVMNQLQEKEEVPALAVPKTPKKEKTPPKEKPVEEEPVVEKPKKEAPTETPKAEPKPAVEPTPEKGEDEKPATDAEEAPEEEGQPSPSDTEVPMPKMSSGSSSKEPPAEEKPPAEEEEPVEEEPAKDTEGKPEESETSAATQMAYQNMKNAEMSGLYFFSPSSTYGIVPGQTSKYEVEGVYELQNGVLMMKVGPDEHQINLCPYTGYSAAVKLPKIDKELLAKERNKITLKSPEGSEEEK